MTSRTPPCDRVVTGFGVLQGDTAYTWRLGEYGYRSTLSTMRGDNAVELYPVNPLPSVNGASLTTNQVEIGLTKTKERGIEKSVLGSLAALYPNTFLATLAPWWSFGE